MREFAGAPIRGTARLLWLLDIAFTRACAVGLWLLGMTPFQAVNHAMTTTSTGGLGTEGDSLDSFGWPVRLWVLGFMFLCGVSFPLYLVLLRGGRDLASLRSHDETRWFLIFTASASVAVLTVRAVVGPLGNGLADAALETAFNVVSVATTTGFGAGDHDT